MRITEPDPVPPPPEVWEKKASLPEGEQRMAAVGFSVNGVGYVCSGTNGGVHSKKLWQYNPANNTWAEKAPLPAEATNRWFGSSFVIGDKAYMLAGRSEDNFLMNDLWEYNTADNTWTQRASLPNNGLRRWQAVSFSLNGKGYIGLGTSINCIQDNDLWEYDSQTDTWAQKTSLPFVEGRVGAACFTIDNKAYIVGGQKDNIRLNDTWEYDPAGQGTWTKKASLPDDVRKCLAMAFSVNGKGYLVGGLTGDAMNSELTKDTWEYDPKADQWNQKDAFLEQKWYAAAIFVIGNDAYICTGNGAYNKTFGDLLKFNP